MHLIDANDKKNQLYVSQEVLDCMQRIPPIDPESLRPQGEWIYKKYEDEDIWLYYCSECDTPNANKRNYCSNCGAKMKGETK